MTICSDCLATSGSRVSIRQDRDNSRKMPQQHMVLLRQSLVYAGRVGTANAILSRVRMPSDRPTVSASGLRYLQMLEAESISIIREAVAECARPVMLYSIGKDSSVLLHLALKAFYPAPLPFPTTWASEIQPSVF